MKPLAIDLFCGLGGWTEGLLQEGYYVVGFDIERHVYGEHRYPAQLVIQDVLTLDGRQFKDAALIVASPPCQEFSHMAMPWTRAKERARQYRSGELNVKDLTALFDAAVRIGKQAGVPTVIENVRGAIPWVGRSQWNYGSYHLWGDVPALMPMTMKRGGDALKAPGRPRQGRQDYTGVTPRLTNPAEHIKQGGDWFATEGSISRTTSSKSTKRKMASALIAKIPLPLSRHIARTYFPRQSEAEQ